MQLGATCNRGHRGLGMTGAYRLVLMLNRLPRTLARSVVRLLLSRLRVTVMLTVEPVLLMLVHVRRCRLPPFACDTLLRVAALLLFAWAQTWARPITFR